MVRERRGMRSSTRTSPICSSDLSAPATSNFGATVLLRELREFGYAGGVTQLKEYLRLIRPSAPLVPLIRFETPPGKQLQADFVVFRRGPSPLRAFTAELGYSRYPFGEFTDGPPFFRTPAGSELGPPYRGKGGFTLTRRQHR
jgi:transposase